MYISSVPASDLLMRVSPPTLDRERHDISIPARHTLSSTLQFLSFFSTCGTFLNHGDTDVCSGRLYSPSRYPIMLPNDSVGPLRNPRPRPPWIRLHLRRVRTHPRPPLPQPDRPSKPRCGCLTPGRGEQNAPLGAKKHQEPTGRSGISGPMPAVASKSDS